LTFFPAVGQTCVAFLNTGTADPSHRSRKREWVSDATARLGAENDRLLFVVLRVKKAVLLGRRENFRMHGMWRRVDRGDLQVGG
jgi:hypothetical protein